jgi:hypothetical protein
MFLSAMDGRLVDGQGQPVLLRGVGLGNWLLPEGYMWTFEPPGPQSPRQIEDLVVDLVGEADAARFWADFRDRFITDADLARIAAEGMNHVRLPINSRVLLSDDGTFREDGFATIDWVIERCRVHGLWVVLDLHGAPGGQTGTNIDDSPRGVPELFTSRHYQEQTIALWRALARRYRDEPVVAGYDLLNEPLPNEYQHRHAGDLVALYRELTEAIRAEDPNHLVIYEGTHWASNWDIFTEVWDPQSMLQFHRYWSAPDRPGIQRYLDVREKLNLPIYMGEGGENNLAWLQTAFQLYEDEEISWNFWPWKKIDTVTSPCSVIPPAGWDAVVRYAAGRGERPSPENAQRTLLELLDAFDLEACVYRPEVVNALLRRPPLTLPASGFSFRGEGISYATASPRPLPGFREDDLVTVVRSPQTAAPLDFSHTKGQMPDDRLQVRLEAGDWVCYDIHVTEPATLLVTTRLEGVGDPAVSVDDSPVDRTGVVHVGAGRHAIRVAATSTLLLDGVTVEPVDADGKR